MDGPTSCPGPVGSAAACLPMVLRGLYGQLASLTQTHRPHGQAPLQGYEAFMDGSYELALLYYLHGAALGSELAQSNAAWMLTNSYVYKGPHAAALAMQLYRQAAEQGNHEALLQIGDAYYYGRGVPQDWEHAAQVKNVYLGGELRRKQSLKPCMEATGCFKTGSTL